MARVVKEITLLLKETANFYRFYRNTPKTDKAIVFYAEHEGYYAYFEGLIEKLISGHNRTLCYVTSDPDDPILRTPESRIRTFYLNKLLTFFMAFINCKVFVMTLTDLGQYHLRRSVNPVHYVYIFHAIASTHMWYTYGAFDHYDSILCVGPHHVKEIRRHEELSKLSPKVLVEAGYYRLERIYQAYQKYTLTQPSSDIRETILIAPSWGAASVLESCGERLVGILLEADYAVIVRPHPETVKRSPDLIASLVSKFANNTNCFFEMSVATDDSLLRADVLISDYSGITLEYAFGTERPVIFLDVPYRARNQRYKELGLDVLESSLRSEIGVVVSLEKLETVPEVISNLISKRLSYKKHIAELRKQYVYAFGHSSEIGAQYIIDLTYEEKEE